MLAGRRNPHCPGPIRIGIRKVEYGFPRISALGSSVNRGNLLLIGASSSAALTLLYLCTIIEVVGGKVVKHMPNGIPAQCQEIQDRLEQKRNQRNELADRFAETRDPNVRRALTRCLAEEAKIEEDLQNCVATPQASNLRIAGIELTQAIQFFNFNGKGSGLAPNNSVGLVANKGLILRVYVDRTALPNLPVPTRVTGRVSYPGKPELTPINGPINAKSGDTINRGNPQHTLNFRVPARDCTSIVPFTATVFDPAHPTEDAYRSPPFTINAAFEPVPRLRVHIVSFHYTGLGLDLPAPSRSESLGAVLRLTPDVYPVKGIEFTDYEVLPRGQDFRSTTCTGNWNLLTTDLWLARLFSFTNDVYLGLLPAEVPRSYA
jgi:hypothetical protein